MKTAPPMARPFIPVTPFFHTAAGMSNVPRTGGTALWYLPASIGGATKTAWELVLDYDLPGYTDALNKILLANGKDTLWIPSI